MKRTPLNRRQKLDPTTDEASQLAFPKPVRPEKKRKGLQRRPPPPGTPQRHEYMDRKPARRLSRPGNDTAYRAWLEKQHCCSRGLPGSRCWGRIDPSHMGDNAKYSGMAMKAPDKMCAAQCRGCHEDWEHKRGPFQGWTKDQRKEWGESQYLAAQAAYVAAGGVLDPRERRSAA